MTKRKASSNLAETPISPIDGLLKSLDLVAVDMEARYGAGILPTLCTPETAGKFMRVHEALNVAIEAGDYDTVKAKVESLKRGWLKMEEEAKASGYLKMVEAWYVCSPTDGIQYIICKHEADSAILAAQNPSKASAIFSLSTIARMIEQGSVVNLQPQEKQIFTKAAKDANLGELLSDRVPF